MHGILFAIAVIVAVVVAAHIKGKGVKRSSNNVIAGVCSGIAKHYGWDVTAVRIIWFVLAVTVAGPVLAYILLWIMLDSE